MSVATIKAGIVSKLQEIVSIAKTLDYIIWTDDWSVIYEKFTDGTKVNVWQIGLASSPSNVAIGQGYKTRTYFFNLVGYYSHSTENQSSKVFENIVGEVINKFEESYSIVSGANMEVFPNLLSINSTLYLQHPCHTAVIQIGIKERVALATNTQCE